VRLLQEYLTRAGFDTLGIDGVFGNNTFNAVVAFQKTYNIPADGVVYMDTFEALANVVASYEAAGVVKLDPREAGSAVPAIEDTPLWGGGSTGFKVETVEMRERPVSSGYEPLPPLALPGTLPKKLRDIVPTWLLVTGSLLSLGVFAWALTSKPKSRPAPVMAGYSRRRRRSRR
jgi:peptidoglycan hydrolase-like protein with peptidoglycan-binding domain